MNQKLQEFSLRTLTGAVLAGVTVSATLLSQWSFGALLLVILVGCMSEFYRMCARAGARPQRVLGTVLGVSVLAGGFLATALPVAGGGTLRLLAALAIYTILLGAAVFVCELYRRSERPMWNIGATLMGVAGIAFPLMLLSFLPELGDPGYEWNPWVVIAYFVIIWANDIFAYLVGMSLGRRRMMERISPKKSWEGFFGGVIAATAVGAAAGWLLDAPVWMWAGVGLVASLSGVLGDLVESMFKRSAGIKDSGRIMPGHGGWFDRFDALIMSVPFVFAYLALLRLFT